MDLNNTTVIEENGGALEGLQESLNSLPTAQVAPVKASTTEILSKIMAVESIVGGVAILAWVGFGGYKGVKAIKKTVEAKKAEALAKAKEEDTIKEDFAEEV